ncbi:hypothetical protein U1Q18_041432 [Sarracenia purpurea var. burkii]
MARVCDDDDDDDGDGDGAVSMVVWQQQQSCDGDDVCYCRGERAQRELGSSFVERRGVRVGP